MTCCASLKIQFPVIVFCTPMILNKVTKLSCLDAVRQYNYYLIKYIRGYLLLPTARVQPETDPHFHDYFKRKSSLYSKMLLNNQLKHRKTALVQIFSFPPQTKFVINEEL